MQGAQQASAEAESNIFVARQPIFLKNQRVFAYELLFRSGLENYFDSTQDSGQATSKVISHSFLMIGISKITDGKKAFINFNKEMLHSEYASLFPKDITVVEVLEDVAVTPEVVAACRNLRRKGYVVALDDFQYDPEFIPLLELAQVVKFDLRQTGMEELARQVKAVSPYKVRLLAEKVETIEEFEQAKALGFDLFQGYFFKKPNIITGRDIPGSKIQYLRILQQIQDENYDYEKLAHLVSRDVSLSYKLLRYVNSAYFSLRREVQAVQDAIAMLGEINLRKWLSLMLLAYLATDKPPELLRLSIMRGSFCEQIAKLLPVTAIRPAEFYTVGMFSLLDAMLNQSMARLVDELNLGGAVRDALLGREAGPLLNTLCLVRAYESGDWAPLESLARSLAIDLDALPSLYDAALAEANRYGLAD